MDSIDDKLYSVFSKAIKPTLVFAVGLAGLSLSLHHKDSRGFLIPCTYIIYEAVDTCIDYICDKQIEKGAQKNKEEKGKKKNEEKNEEKNKKEQNHEVLLVKFSQLLSTAACVAFLIIAIVVYTKTDRSNKEFLNSIIFSVPVLFKLFENIMEISFAEKALKNTVLALDINDLHIRSVIRDGYRFLLSKQVLTQEKIDLNRKRKSEEEEDRNNKSKSQEDEDLKQKRKLIDETKMKLIREREESLKKDIEKTQTMIDRIKEGLTDATLDFLHFHERVKGINLLLKGEPHHEGRYKCGTGTSFYKYFGMEKIAESEVKLPEALKSALEQDCPFSKEGQKVKDTHFFFYLPAYVDDGTSANKASDKVPLRSSTQTRDIEKGTDEKKEPELLTAKVMSNKMENFIPGIGCIWRYEPIEEEKRKKNEWVLMYKGENDDIDAGILKESLGKSWAESEKVLEKYDEYDAMTNAEVIMGTYSYFLKTGKAMFRERFTRVKELTSTASLSRDELKELSLGETSHLYIGRFNQSGLNNDAYLDVGGDHNQHANRGLSVCRRFFVD